MTTTFLFVFSVRKAYYKLSLSCHPDRVEQSKKDEANEKFKVLSEVHSILADPEKRAIYDESECINKVVWIVMD